MEKFFFKVYAQGAINPHPVQLLYGAKLKAALTEAVTFQVDEFLDGHSSMLDGLPEAERIKDALEHAFLDGDVEKEAEKMDDLLSLVSKMWDAGEEIGCGDWGLVKSDSADPLFIDRPCKW